MIAKVKYYGSEPIHSLLDIYSKLTFRSITLAPVILHGFHPSLHAKWQPLYKVARFLAFCAAVECRNDKRIVAGV